MKTTLEKIRELLGGTADDQTVTDIRHQLREQTSEASLFFAGARSIAQDPFAIDCAELAYEAEKTEVESADSATTLPLDVSEKLPNEAIRLQDATDLELAVLAHLGDYTSLQSLNLSGCKRVTDVGLAHLQGLTSLQSLNLSGCEVKDAGLALLKGLISLHSLDLGGSWQLTDAGLVHLGGPHPCSLST